MRSAALAVLVAGTLCAVEPVAGRPRDAPPWGFYAHREINRLAIATVPAPLARFYKTHAAYVSAHAVDPDKRRYAAPLEGPRHFIDLERFGGGTDRAAADGRAEGALAGLPRGFADFHRRYTTLTCVRGGAALEVWHDTERLWVGDEITVLPQGDYRDWYRANVLRAFYRELDTLHVGLPIAGPGCDHLKVTDTMTRHGILPYHLTAMQARLTAAFGRADWTAVRRLSAEIGHYIGDATVPLHTTVNYDGQLTGQRGIHAFWESRLPELFAAEAYDGLVGRARYIDDPTSFYREIVAESHGLVDTVLAVEAALRRDYPADAQTCYEERLGRVTPVPCRGFARAFSDRLGGMVEARFRRAVAAVGAAWYTAWVDAGQPGVPETGAVTPAQDTSYARVPGAEGRGH